MPKRVGFSLFLFLAFASFSLAQNAEVSARIARDSESPGRKAYIYVTYRIPAGFHQEENPTLFTFTVEGNGITQGDIQYPQGIIKDGRLRYEGTVTLSALLTLQPDWDGTASVRAKYQLCNEKGTCFIPQTVTLSVEERDGPAVGESNSLDRSGGLRTLIFILLAFLGGIILNVMPCVLPVLSIKVFSLIKQSELGKRDILRHALAYAAGILASFFALAGVVVILKTLGREVGWGFQFQNPAYNITLLSVVFIFALSLFDVFVINTPSVGTIANRKKGSGTGASFMSGVFAVALATPCTAPLLGTALGFAFSQPPLLIFVFFLAIGLGLSLPFLIVGFFPGLVYRIPKPGPWMSLVKEVMGFALLLTDLWLFSVIGGQTGVQGVLRSLGFLLALGVAGWVWGRFGSPTETAKRRIKTGIAAVIIIAAGGFAAFRDFSSIYAQNTTQGESAQLPDGFVQFSEAALTEGKAAGKPVFVAFSAKWCLTCMTNEKTVLSRRDVKAAFEKNGVLLLYADYTNSNDQIASWLSRFGRAGVPLYLYYRPGKDEPEILPEILTSRTILSLFERD